MKRYTTGYIMVPGFRPADVIGTQAVLGPHPLDKSLFVAASLDPVTGKSGMTLVPNATFDTCPDLDVLVIGDIPETALDDPQLINFLRARIPAARHVIGVSAGVMALARTGLLEGRSATTDAAHRAQLGNLGVRVPAQTGPVTDGPFVTAGPSTGMIEAAYTVQAALRGPKFTKLLELNLEYDPKVQFAALPDTAGQTPQAPDTLTVAAVVPDWTYAPDFMGAVDVLGSLPGTGVLFVSDTLDPSRGLLGPTMMPNATYDTCPQADVVIVGALGPQHSANPALLNFLRRQDKQAKAMISVCAGSLVFGAAGLLDGKNATSNFHHTSLLRKFGATPSHKAVERDGNYFSAGPAIGSYEIALQVVADLYGPRTAQMLERDVLEYTPNPLFGMGDPYKTNPVLRWISKALVSPSLPIYKATGRRGQKRIAG